MYCGRCLTTTTGGSLSSPCLLDGLNMEFDMVLTHILHRTPIPFLQEAFNMILNNEDRQKSLSANTPPDRSALTSVSRGQVFSPSSSAPICDYCGRKGHTQEVCYKFHPHLAPRGHGRGRRPRHGGHRQGSSRPHDATYLIVVYDETSTAVPGQLNAHELDAFRRLLHSQPGQPPGASASIASIAMPSAHATTASSSERVIDSGANYYMTGSSSSGTGYEVEHWQW